MKCILRTIKGIFDSANLSRYKKELGHCEIMKFEPDNCVWLVLVVGECI